MRRLLACSVPLVFAASIAVGRPAHAAEPAPAGAAATTPPAGAETIGEPRPPSVPPDPAATPSAPTPDVPKTLDVTATLPVQQPAKTWRFSGMLGVLALPRLLSVEVLAKYMRSRDPRWELAAFGVQLEYLPSGIAKFGGTTSLSWLQIGAEGRYHPWRFVFVGAGFGYQFSQADSEKFGSAVSYRTTSLFFAPKIGVLHTFASGLTIGGDLGVTVPIAPSTKLDSDGQEDAGARKVAKTFGMFVMPYATLFRVGYTY